jgi:hypothetical protein
VGVTTRRARRAARWPRGSGWEFSPAALAEPTQGELDFERKRREERVAEQLKRRARRRKRGPQR